MQKNTIIEIGSVPLQELIIYIVLYFGILLFIYIRKTLNLLIYRQIVHGSDKLIQLVWKRPRKITVILLLNNSYTASILLSTDFKSSLIPIRLMYKCKSSVKSPGFALGVHVCFVIEKPDAHDIEVRPLSLGYANDIAQTEHECLDG